MPDQMQTTSPKFPFDMTCWCREKADVVVINLAYQVDQLRAIESASGESNKDMHRYISNALFDATKLLSYFCEVEWSVQDHELILEKGYEGYEELAVRCKLIEKTSRLKEEECLQRKQDKFARFVCQLREYLNGPRSPNRTLIHELLDQNPETNNNPIVKRISDLIWEVTMGNAEWEDFVEETEALLDEISV